MQHCIQGWSGIAQWTGVPMKDLIDLPRWTSENRPYVDTSKPANGAEPEQEYLYPEKARLGKHFPGSARWVYTDFTWAEDRATQGCDPSAAPAGKRTFGRNVPLLERHAHHRLTRYKSTLIL